MDPEILVVGAGPVGLTMAAELKRYGVSVRIVDTAAQRSDTSRALVLWSRTLELLDRAAISERFVAAGRKVVAGNIIAGHHTIAHIGFAEVHSPFAYALMLPQSDTERLLEEYLGELGVPVERQVALTGFSDDGDAVSAQLRHPDGREESLEVDWLIGCDGAHSTVRHGLGLQFQGDTLPSDWILADAHLSGLKLPESEMAIYWHQDGLLAVFPISPGRYRVVADAGPAVGDHPAQPTLQQVQEVVDRRGPGGVAVSDPIWLSGFRINERKVARYRSGRVFVAGDAAHVHSPAGGQGMNTGMQDAFNLAWKLALVCRSTRWAERLLDSYSVERSAVGDQVLKESGRLTAVGVMHSHAAQTVRNVLSGVLFGLGAVQRAAADALTEVSIGYKHSPLNGPHAHGLGGPEPGERAAPVAGQAPVGAGDAPRFALFAAKTEDAAAMLHDFPTLLEPALRPPFKAGGAWLVRPDGYAAAVAKDRDLLVLAEYLREL